VAASAGPLRSLSTLLGLGIGVPDHTTFCLRSANLALATALAQNMGRFKCRSIRAAY